MGTIEDDAIGSSRHATIFGSASSKVDLVIVTAIVFGFQYPCGFRGIRQLVIGNKLLRIRQYRWARMSR